MKNQGPSTQCHSFARWDALVVLFFCATTAVSSPGQTFTKVADLTTTSGTNVQYPLVQGFDGNLYGTAFYGGAYANGTFFTVTPSGTLTTLHSFCKKRVSDCADGVNPGAIALGPNGKFYGGTANVVGKTNSIPGTIYKISSLGSLTTLHTFCTGSCDDGTSSGPLTLAWNGYFYGVSYPSAANSSAFHNVVFKVSPSGVFTTVLDVCPGGVCPSGGGPTGGLFENGGGLFFGNGFSVGTTIQQALYKMTLSGTPSLAYTFCSNSEQCGSGIPSFLQATNGDIYGTFGAGGLGGKLCLDTVEGCGIAFRISLAEGTYVKLHDFCSGANCADGATPRPLIQAADGNLYGVTAGEYRNPQVYSYGTVFKLTPAGRFTVLHTFSAADPLGYEPNSPLYQATDGNLYGTTSAGGASNVGTIFRISLGLPPFVRTVQNEGKVGSSVVILGNNLTGSVSVTFNGTPAAFTVVSDTEIIAVVPSGATSGSIEVSGPRGGLASATIFHVFP